jgi:hypothetical protein
VKVPPTLLELLLPEGQAARVLGIGSQAPAWLESRPESEPADLVIVAPGPEEAGRPERVGQAIDRAAAAATPQGLLYLMLPPRTRRGAISRLRALGYGALTPFVHHPGFARTEHLVPADRASLRRWLDSGEGASPVRRRAAAAALAVPGAERLAVAILPQLGLAAARAESPALFGWLARASRNGVVRARVRAKWRGARGGAVVTGLDGAGAPTVVAKIALGGEDAEMRSAREAERLARLGPTARQAGALVPTATLAQLPGGWPVLLMAPMRGESAASLIGRKAQPPEAVIAGLAEWLVRWNRATQVPGHLDAEWIERRLVAPATALSGELPDAYLAWLRGEAESAMGESLPAIATHGDLTMTNVLLDGGSLAVVDWEAAEESGTPLRDLLYAGVDAMAARTGYRDRPADFERCFPAGGTAAGPLAAGLERLRRQAGLGDAATTLCVHACWLQHAADERSKRGPGDARPFLAIVRTLAERAARGEPAW